MLSINNFLFKAQIDNINLFKVVESVKLLFKIASKHHIHPAKDFFNVISR